MGLGRGSALRDQPPHCWNVWILGICSTSGCNPAPPPPPAQAARLWPRGALPPGSRPSLPRLLFGFCVSALPVSLGWEMPQAPIFPLPWPSPGSTLLPGALGPWLGCHCFPLSAEKAMKST